MTEYYQVINPWTQRSTTVVYEVGPDGSFGDLVPPVRFDRHGRPAFGRSNQPSRLFIQQKTEMSLHQARL